MTSTAQIEYDHFVIDVPKDQSFGEFMMDFEKWCRKEKDVKKLFSLSDDDFGSNMREFLGVLDGDEVIEVDSV